MCAVYHGKKGLVYVSTTGTGDAAAVLKLTTWSLDMTVDTVDTTSFGDTNKTYVQGLKDVKGKLSGFWNSGVDTLFTAADSADGCKIYLYPSSDAVTIYWYGPAWLNMSLSSGIGDAVKVDGGFVANGTWAKKP